MFKLRALWKWLGIILGTLISACQCQKSLAAENLAMRQQLATLKHRNPRPSLTRFDRIFWLLLSRIWDDWQNAYAERVIGSICRECLDHVIVLGERQLRRILSVYADYYNWMRTHLCLAKDAPEP